MKVFPCPSARLACDKLPVIPGGSRPQAGVALITVLLIVFLATVAATSLASLQQFAIRRSTLLQHQQQARLYALGVEQWAAAILKRDLKHDLEQNQRVDSLDEDWAVMPPALPVEGGFIKGHIQDLQGRFNLNNLLKTTRHTEAGSAAAQEPGARQAGRNNRDRTDPNDSDTSTDEGVEGAAENDLNASGKGKQNSKSTEKDKDAEKDAEKDTDENSAKGKPVNKQQLQVLQRLLEILELDPTIADAIVDWIDANQDQRPNGAEDSYYAGQNPPYAAANRPLISLSELRLIKGINQVTYEKLAPYVCVLPPGTPLNVNTAAPVVLAALDENPDLSRFAKAEDSPPEVYKKVSDFIQAKSLGGKGLTAKIDLSVNSHYFLVEVEAQVGGGRAVLHSLLQRSDNGDIRVLLHSFGNGFSNDY